MSIYEKYKYTGRQDKQPKQCCYSDQIKKVKGKEKSCEANKKAEKDGKLFIKSGVTFLIQMGCNRIIIHALPFSPSNFLQALLHRVIYG